MSEHEAIGNDGLIAFFSARLDEDEAAAKVQGALDEAQGSVTSAGASFGARFSPARVLREVAAGRQLITAYEESSTAVDNQAEERMPGGMPGVAQMGDTPLIAPDLIEGYARAPGLPVLTALGQEVARRAAIWSDHPAYQPEWTPADDSDST